MTQKRADAAPGDGGAAAVAEETERLQHEDDAAKLPKPVITPPPAPGIEEQQAEAKSSWVDANVVNAWLSVKSQDTRETVIESIGRSVLERFNADADMAVGKAVTNSWLDNQLAVYSFPITIDDVKSKTREIFETNGVEVREG